jgi:hypothetical protein
LHGTMEFDNWYSERPVSAVSNFWPFSESTFCREIPSRGEDNHAPLYQAPQDITTRHHYKTSLQNITAQECHRTVNYPVCQTSTGPRKNVAEPAITNATIYTAAKREEEYKQSVSLWHIGWLGVRARTPSCAKPIPNRILPASTRKISHIHDQKSASRKQKQKIFLEGQKECISLAGNRTPASCELFFRMTSRNTDHYTTKDGCSDGSRMTT